MLNVMKSVLIICMTAFSISACTETSGSSMSDSEIMMSRAQILASKSSITSAQLNEKFAEGVKLKSIEGSVAGKNVAESCQAVKSDTDPTGVLDALDADAALILASCAGFLS